MLSSPTWIRVVVFGLLAVVSTSPIAAQDSTPAPFSWAVSATLTARDSGGFRFPDTGGPARLTVVDSGFHVESSRFSLFLDWNSSPRSSRPRVEARLKLDAVDLPDRNPTSSGRTIDLDEAWVRWRIGRNPDAPKAHAGPSRWEVTLGKFAPFERARDRWLESYGLATTALSRFEDVGLGTEVDFGRWSLWASFTQGNPLFLRDPNQLAGDLGSQDPRQERYLSGVPIFYDTDVRDLDFSTPEVGLGVAIRGGDEAGWNHWKVTVWSRSRRLASARTISGAELAGDLALFSSIGSSSPFELRGRRKRETGFSAVWHRAGWSLESQRAWQSIAGLDRTAMEFSLAKELLLPLRYAWRGRQLFPAIVPAIRFSRLDPDFSAPGESPFPSVGWRWEKWDLGLRLAVIGPSSLTLEYTRHEVELANGSQPNFDELLLTVRWTYEG